MGESKGQEKKTFIQICEGKKAKQQECCGNRRKVQAGLALAGSVKKLGSNAISKEARLRFERAKQEVDM